MNQKQKAKEFAKLHIKGNPIIIYNAWDAGSAKAIVDGGADAIGTSSWAVAAAQGYKDGENIPLEHLLEIAERIAKNVDVPVSLDFEGGFTEDNKVLAKNITRAIEAGVIGINFEDQVVKKGDSLYEIQVQAKRIKAVREAAEDSGVDLFINARTDVFFQGGVNKKTVADAIARGRAYARAGASGLFVPGLVDPSFIEQICSEVDIPVNIMVSDETPARDRLAKLGVSRISYGIIPYVSMMKNLTKSASVEFKK